MVLISVNHEIYSTFAPLITKTMKKTILLLFIVSLFTQFAAAQMALPGSLTVKSDDGSKFYLELNGRRYNDKPQAKVRIEDLPATTYDAKVVFENNARPQLSRNIMIADDRGKAQDVTYSIKKNKKGKMALNPYAASPAYGNSPRPDDCVVYCYDNPYYVVAGPGMYPPGIPYPGSYPPGPGMGNNGTVVTTTTTTTTTTTGGGNYGYPPNPNGGYYGGQNGYPVYDQPVYDPAAGPCRYAMPAADFEQAKAIVKDNSFDDTKLSTAQEIITSNCVTAVQILEITKLFAFEQTKLEFAKFAYLNCIDKNNYFKVGNALKFEHSKKELNEYIRSVK